MPRKAPTQVIEQRVTLGDLERSQVIPLIDEARQLVKTGRIAAQVTGAAVATGVVVAGLGVGLAGYSFYSWVTDSTLVSDLGNWLDEQRIYIRGKGKPAGFTNSKGEELESLGIFFPFNQWVSWIP